MTATACAAKASLSSIEVDVVERPAGLGQQSPHRFDRRHQHVFGRQAAHGLADDAGHGA